MNKILKYSMIMCAGLSLPVNSYAKRYPSSSMQAQSAQGVSEVNSAMHLGDMLKNNEWVVAKFYSPHCIHCKHYRPEFIKAARNQAMNNFKFVAIDVDAHPDVAQKYHIGGLPTTLIMHNAKKVDEFGGNTSANNVVKQVKRAAQQ